MPLEEPEQEGYRPESAVSLGGHAGAVWVQVPETAQQDQSLGTQRPQEHPRRTHMV